MESMRSYFVPNTKETLQEDEDFINRKRTNEDTREFYCAKLFNKNLLVQFCSDFPTETIKEEHECCHNVVGKASHVKETRASDMVHDTTSSAPKADNTTIRKAGVDFAPLLEGNIQLGKVGTFHKNLAMNEFRLRNVASLSTDGIHMLAAKIKESECPGWIDLEKDMNDEQNTQT